MSIPAWRALHIDFCVQLYGSSSILLVPDQVIISQNKEKKRDIMTQLIYFRLVLKQHHHIEHTDRGWSACGVVGNKAPKLPWAGIIWGLQLKVDNESPMFTVQNKIKQFDEKYYKWAGLVLIEIGGESLKNTYYPSWGGIKRTRKFFCRNNGIGRISPFPLYPMINVLFNKCLKW